MTGFDDAVLPAVTGLAHLSFDGKEFRCRTGA